MIYNIIILKIPITVSSVIVHWSNGIALVHNTVVIGQHCVSYTVHNKLLCCIQYVWSFIGENIKLRSMPRGCVIVKMFFTRRTEMTYFDIMLRELEIGLIITVYAMPRQFFHVASRRTVSTILCLLACSREHVICCSRPHNNNQTVIREAIHRNVKLLPTYVVVTTQEKL